LATAAKSLLADCNIAAPMIARLTTRKRLFVLDFLCTSDAAESARNAGYSAKNASVQGSKLLNDPLVQQALEALGNKVRKQYEIQRDEILMHLYYCATRSGAELFDKNGKLTGNIHDMPERIQQAIDGVKQRIRTRQEVCPHCGAQQDSEEVNTEYKLAPKLGALDMAMRHKGLFAAEEHRHEHKLTIDFDQLSDAIERHENTIEGRVQKVLEK
jgi:phage terminase small subunit